MDIYEYMEGYDREFDENEFDSTAQQFICLLIYLLRPFCQPPAAAQPALFSAGLPDTAP